MLKFLAGLAVLSLGLVWGAPTYTLRYNHVLGPNHPYHAALQQWAQRVSERTNGDLQILVFHSAQLGVEEDIIEQLRQGVPVGQNTDGARLGNYVREFGVFNGPYFVDSYQTVERLVRLPVVQTWTDRLANQYGIRVLCFNWVQGYRHFMTNKPIRTPQDLQGLRIRTPPAPVWQESVRALGATPVALPFGEIYSALQQRAIDGVELVYANIPDMSLWEVVRYVNETKHFLLINFQVVGEAWFRRLPANYRNILTEECRRAGQAVSRQIEENEARIKQDIQRRGMTIVSDINLTLFQQAGLAAYQRLGIFDVRRLIYSQLGLER
ncbi:MAG: C4-dicarboxylate TRAP transporter substrate-binding protein [Meiothermus sp.]|uniref:C4-dicarboxylate TRAP transporter substrate-binding protein n=1 Tax=Meiothermus sp. TaxID=1955249 RepID=UPI0025D4E73C|nr:C4-dicarboxylate TRAP transporter substrate-binding protein [Meiothermus sp.]MCS7059292.1 C4-dicarboxylate TRAP transporter substrate-binding protein [Meiothermus sp.]MCS7195165.1 C4-dicarboxylate TRAP transporter substrate-binding protein [Meiothermus sp.]MCX7740968.1 C4-dicarboxylate TRAP transporter substrate-binding protein [Meiothermus sp.]MDW8091708.1 C4-dicarboxylate TRAP transporter substrate-binding protein [Meiothermus sp.]MDW8482112.1 C4-dicarboxylate TRAP transporter substrate-b